MLGGDIGSIVDYDQTDVVITSMGYPKNSKKAEDESKLRVNVDMYYVDKSGGEPRVRIIDLGIYVVPYHPSKKTGFTFKIEQEKFKTKPITPIKTIPPGSQVHDLRRSA